MRFNLAVALARSGELVEASELARSVVADQAEGSPVEAAAALVRELAPRLAWLSLRAATPAPELRLVFDGELLAPALRGVPMPVDPGEHAVALERGGTPVVEFVIELLEGERRDLALEEPSVDAVPVAERPSVWTRWWLWTAVGVVAAGLAVGAAFVLG